MAEERSAEETGDTGAPLESYGDLSELRAEVEQSPRARALYQDAMHRTAFLASGQEIRKKSGLSQEKVAERMGTRQPSISDLESGRTDPHLRTMQRYARALGRRLDVAILDEEAPALGNELWLQLAEVALSPLLTRLATEGSEGRALSALARSVSLPAPTVRPILGLLEAGGWAKRREQDGDPVYSLVGKAAYVIGVTLTRGRVVGVLMYNNGDVVTYAQMGPVDSTRGEVVDATCDVVRQLYQHRDDLPVIGVGASIAGVVQDGIVAFAPDLRDADDPWNGVDLESLLQEGIHKRVANSSLRVAVENDANALAVQEALWPGDESVVVVLMSGAGIGTGLVIDGKVVRGAHGAAGESGHTVVDPEGPPCRAGFPHHGCLETVASAQGILVSLGLRSGNVYELEKSLAVADQGVHGDSAAQEAFRKAGGALGRSLATSLSLVDPVRAVLFGHPELTNPQRHRSAQVFQAAVQEALEQAASVWGHLAETPRLEWKELQETTSAVAAGAVAMRHILARPTKWIPTMMGAARPVEQLGTR